MLLDGWIQGWKKTFSFKHDSRKLNKCPDCDNDCFFNKCLYCNTSDDYEKSKEQWK